MSPASRKPLDQEGVAALVAFAKDARLEEVIWENGDQKVAFRLRLTPKPAPAPAAPLPSTGTPPADGPSKAHFITSPIVGTFFRAPKDRPALVTEGDEVSVGDKVGLVEAMKVPRDVFSKVGGRVLRILVENGKPVEYGQKIFEVEVISR